MRWILVLVVFALILLPGEQVGAIQNTATPTGIECPVQPLLPAELKEIVAAGFEPVSALDPTADHPPATALLAIFDVLSDSLACTNANQPMSALALFSDRYLAERFAGPDGNDELGHLLAAATRTPGPAAPDDRLVLVAVSDLILYADGRIGAEVTTANVEDAFTDLIVFVETDDGWRIDQVVLGADDSTVGTPSARSQDP
jgi:hypothetical protein